MRAYSMPPFTHVCLDSSTPHRDSETTAKFCRKMVKEAPVQARSQCCMHFGNGLIVVTRNSLRMKDEIVLLMLLMPLMHVDIRLQVSHLAVCTDASELGGGLCYSTGLTRCEGVQACWR